MLEAHRLHAPAAASWDPSFVVDICPELYPVISSGCLALQCGGRAAVEGHIAGTRGGG